MPQPSKVMALVPAYASAGIIQETLDSLSAQTYPNFEVLVSVDVCNDGTYETCLAHSEQDSRFRVIRQQGERLGYSGNCNFLMDEADADYVMLAFHDDLLEPEFTEKLCRVLDQRPEVILAFPDTYLTNPDGSQEHWKFTALEGLETPLQRGLVMQGRPRLWWAPNRGMFRLKEARAIGGIKPHRAGEFSVDYPWLFHMSLLGEFARVPETLVHKRYQPDSLSRLWEFSGEQWLEAMGSCMRELWNADIATEYKLLISRRLHSEMGLLHDRLKGTNPAMVFARRALRKLRSLLPGTW
ncbi:glycosyltransferase family 2 protein [Pseudohaliea sp.]|uniref:glycosyltransferase family 2 protein n=1 Tax=Pseudohaliea sp. TaxID=2740289 RepID=UPI0032EB1C6F